jgi:hypothetical protein
MALLLWLPLTHARACDEPGTPNQENAVAIGSGAIRLSWIDTASEHGVYFDIEGQRDPSVANYGPYNGNRGSRVEYEIFHLQNNVQHCFRIWSRTSANGCRSQLPSAWACATPTPNSKDPRAIGGTVSPPVGGRRNPPPHPNPGPLPIPYPVTTCIPMGGACSSTEHCCNDAHASTVPPGVTPALCVYGTCKVCVPHGAECQPYGSQTCCSVDDNCKLDQSSGKAVCDIVDGPSKLPILPGRCVQGFVWREANGSDHVCVTPDVRRMTADDNAHAERERCVPGHVWREAFAGDHVCVPPQTRAQAWNDNAQQRGRTVR